MVKMGSTDFENELIYEKEKPVMVKQEMEEKMVKGDDEGSSEEEQ